MNINNTTLESIIGRINVFNKKCKHEEYTDTGEAWELLASIRTDIKRLLEPPKPRTVKITNGKQAKIICPKCGPVVPRLTEVGFTINHDLVSFNKKTGITANGWNGNSDDVSEEGTEGFFLECKLCGSSWPVPAEMEVEWL